MVENCRISYNTGTGYGGGTTFDSVPSSYMRSCLLTHNYATQGGAIMIYSNNFIENCTIVSNSANSSGGGVQNRGDPDTLDPVGSRFKNCIIWFNSVNSGTYSNYYDRYNGGYYTNCCMAPVPVYGTDNFANDPLFVDKDKNDWRITRNSPCLNRGVNEGWMNDALDLAGHPRITGIFTTNVSVGAYEYFINRGSIISTH